MTQPAITVHYLANHPMLADKLALISWTEWQFAYEQRGQCFSDALSTYRQRAKIGSLPLALVAFHGEQFVGTVVEEQGRI